jgi:hypothetical protein
MHNKRGKGNPGNHTRHILGILGTHLGGPVCPVCAENAVARRNNPVSRHIGKVVFFSQRPFRCAEDCNWDGNRDGDGNWDVSCPRAKIGVGDPSACLLC